jgi:hypothetical protein
VLMSSTIWPLTSNWTESVHQRITCAHGCPHKLLPSDCGGWLAFGRRVGSSSRGADPRPRATTPVGVSPVMRE